MAGTGGGTGGGGAGGSGSTAFVTSISGTTPLNTLTADQRTQLCNDVIGYYESAITKANSCRWFAVFNAASSSSPNDTALRNNCTSMENACNQSTETGPGKMTACPLTIPADCNVTVAQYGDCIVAGTALLNQNATTLPNCSMVVLGDLREIQDAQETLNMPPGCATVANACPALIIPVAN